jgi:hypothetical protein
MKACYRLATGSDAFVLVQLTPKFRDWLATRLCLRAHLRDMGSRCLNHVVLSCVH